MCSRPQCQSLENKINGNKYIRVQNRSYKFRCKQRGIKPSEIKDVISVVAEPDGLVFDLDSIKAERIKEDADYEGVRVRFTG